MVGELGLGVPVFHHHARRVEFHPAAFVPVERPSGDLEKLFHGELNRAFRIW